MPSEVLKTMSLRSDGDTFFLTVFVSTRLKVIYIVCCFRIQTFVVILYYVLFT
jgi:hypothetical protein